ncbi:MAG: histidine phosphatase family protein [Dehalococcoidales bacterium]|nr:histidine phosphatase family protein [Dehalococcoidales bacterium]
MTEIVLVRHGETDWNARDIFRGHVDISLNDTGRWQAESASQYLKRVKVAAILYSPLERARQTAQIIAVGHEGITVEPEAGLIDMDFGDWRGKSHPEIKKNHPELYRQWLYEPQNLEFPGGESLDDVRKRVLKVVHQTVEKYKGKVVLVSHRVVLQVIILGLLGLDNSHFWDIRLDTCGITVFEYINSRFILTRHNDTSFLQPPAKKPEGDF